MNRRVNRYMALGGVTGALFAWIFVPLTFITGSARFWAHPKGDFNAYLVAWNYFIRDAWRFPLFDVPGMGYPEGGNVIFNDGLPIAALITKSIHSLTGLTINPFGWWVLLTYVLQGAMAVRLIAACGVRSWWASLCAAIFALGCVSFMWRVGHIALSSHFVLLWALALYFENVRARRFTTKEQFALSAVTLLVNAYLFVMVSLVQAATFLTLWKDHSLRARDWTRAMVAGVAVAAIALAAGYGAIFSGVGSMRLSGFGHYSWNLATLLLPPESFWHFPRGIVRDATGGQYEGEAYIGLGAVLVLLTCVATNPIGVIQAIRRHWVLVVTLVVCTALAATQRIYVASHLVLELPLPDALLDLASFFRASGRFIWLPAYALGLLSLAGLVRWAPRSLAIPVIVMGMLVQIQEASASLVSLREYLGRSGPELLDTSQLSSWMGEHRRIFQFPSWWCGGHMGWTTREANRELQVQLAAARLGVPSNSILTSRQLKDCPAEAQWASRALLEDDVLYLLSKATVAGSPHLSSLAASASCLDAGWMFVCSRRPLASLAPPATTSRTLDISPKVIQVCDGTGLGATTVRWQAPPDTPTVEVRVGKPDGELFARGPAGVKSTGRWVAGGMAFYLMDASKPLTEDYVLDQTSAFLTASGCPPVAVEGPKDRRLDEHSASSSDP